MPKWWLSFLNTFALSVKAFFDQNLAVSQVICICFSPLKTVLFSTLPLASENHPLGASRMSLAEETSSLTVQQSLGRQGEWTNSIQSRSERLQGKLWPRWCFLFLIYEFKAAVGKRRKMGTRFLFVVNAHQLAQYSQTLSSPRTGG